MSLPTTDMMACPTCSTQLRTGARFCDNCGGTINAATDGSSFLDAEQTMMEQASAVGSGGDITIVEPPSDSVRPDSSMDATRLLGGRYELLNELGRGGFAVVHKATDKNLSREVAIKRLHAKSLTAQGASAILTRFDSEARSIAQLKHKNIVEVYDYSNENDDYYIVMEYIEGIGLDRYIADKGKLPIDEAASIVRGVAEGLFYSHKNKLIHRDIKPSNIILVDRGGQLTPKIVDFGLARSGTFNSDLSQTGFAMGTPGYMAPEQCADAKNVDHRADIYSLGKVLYVLISGQKPQDVMPDSIPPPQELSDIIFRCINPKIEDRYFSIQDFIDDLTGVIELTQVNATTMARIVRNVCPTCNAINGAAEKRCKSCAAPLIRACPECSAEISIHRAACNECETDIVTFEFFSKALERAHELAELKRWSQIIKDLEELPDDSSLEGQSGKALIRFINDLRDRAKSKLAGARSLKKNIKKAMEDDSYGPALRFVREYQIIIPDDAEINALPEVLAGEKALADLAHLVSLAEQQFAAGQLTTCGHNLLAAGDLFRRSEPPVRPESAQHWHDLGSRCQRLTADVTETQSTVEKLLSEAMEAMDLQKFRRVKERCDAIRKLTGEHAEAQRLYQRADNLSFQVHERWRAAQDGFKARKYTLAERNCEEVLNIQRDHQEALALLTELRARRVRVGRVSIAVAVFVILSALALGAYHRQNQRDLAAAGEVQNRNNAIELFETHLREANNSFQAAKRSEPSTASIAALADANAAIVAASSTDYARHLDSDQRRRLTDLEDTVNDLLELDKQVLDFQKRYADIEADILQAPEKLDAFLSRFDVIRTWARGMPTSRGIALDRFRSKLKQAHDASRPEVTGVRPDADYLLAKRALEKRQRIAVGAEGPLPEGLASEIRNALLDADVLAERGDYAEAAALVEAAEVGLAIHERQLATARLKALLRDDSDNAAIMAPLLANLTAQRESHLASLTRYAPVELASFDAAITALPADSDIAEFAEACTLALSKLQSALHLSSSRETTIAEFASVLTDAEAGLGAGEDPNAIDAAFTPILLDMLPYLSDEQRQRYETLRAALDAQIPEE
ncbi:MAG: serine/threonine protein kinase [Rhodothermales bacterium]|jgi:serine/threonine protein kinase